MHLQYLGFPDEVVFIPREKVVQKINPSNAETSVSTVYGDFYRNIVKQRTVKYSYAVTLYRLVTSFLRSQKRVAYFIIPI